jgi:hypothetical protein
VGDKERSAIVNNLWQRIEKAVKAKKYLWVPMDQGQPFDSGRTYLRIVVSEMFLEKSLAWFKQWYPAVHVSVQLEFGDQPAAIITRVVKPPEEATKVGVLRNYSIMALTPFSGGTVGIQASLLAMQGADYLGSAIEVLQDFSSLVAPPLGQALTIAEKVANGLDTMLGATKGSARLPYHDTFVGAGMGANELKPGYLAVIRAEATQVAADRLSVQDGQLFYSKSSGAASEPFREADYLLLRIDQTDTRDDYMKLSSIEQAYNDFLDALEKGDQEGVAAAERAAKAAIFRSADLARFDKGRVWDALKKELDEIKGQFGYRAAGIPRRDLDAIVGTWGISMDEAAALGDLTLD